VPALACYGVIFTLNIKLYRHNCLALHPSLQNYNPFDCLLFLSMAQQPLVEQGLLNIEASLSHSDTPHSVGLLWTSEELVEGTSTYTTHNTRTRHQCPGEIRTRNPRKRAAADPRLRRRGHRDWRRICIWHINPVILLHEGVLTRLCLTRKEKSYSHQTRDLFNILPTKLDTLLSPLL
jgi:hypothetical protein